MNVILATNNINKARELRAFFSCSPQIKLLSLAELGLKFTAGEDTNTFEGNARQKAVETAAFLQAELSKRTDTLHGEYIVLADDSGLIVDALDGAPGVDSALYLGENASFETRNAHILAEMRYVPDDARTARFVCAAACVNPQKPDEVLTVTGNLEGSIAHNCAGADGFGYDPIFIPAGSKQTLAEIDLEQKNKISHRAKAMTAMRQLLTQAGVI
jgi:XTP/dITP diphosphohydrolase